MICYLIFVLVFLSLVIIILIVQQNYKIVVVGFYNFENFFDILDIEDVCDIEFMFIGSKVWNIKWYQVKLDNLVKVVVELGMDVILDGVVIFGVLEIENCSVLEDFVKYFFIKDWNYQIVYQDLFDECGIDVVFLYNFKYFELKGYENFFVEFYWDGEFDYICDVFFVFGNFDGEFMYFMVNYWLS